MGSIRYLIYNSDSRTNPCLHLVKHDDALKFPGNIVAITEVRLEETAPLFRMKPKGAAVFIFREGWRIGIP
jgi:hypothetical protein